MPDDRFDAGFSTAVDSAAAWVQRLKMGPGRHPKPELVEMATISICLEHRIVSFQRGLQRRPDKQRRARLKSPTRESARPFLTTGLGQMP